MKSAKKVEPKVEPKVELPVYKMQDHLRKYKARYVKITSPTGNTSLTNFDDVAKALCTKAPEEVVKLASKLLGLDLATRYEKLNPGQRRMNCGNLIRGAIRKGTVQMTEDGQFHASK
jgi:hypothetical protein